jgi:hypothetical protein
MLSGLSDMVQMYLSDGAIRTFEVPVAQFHQLRYKVAKVSQYAGKPGFRSERMTGMVLLCRSCTASRSWSGIPLCGL